MRRLLSLLACLWTCSSAAQTLDVTFRFVPEPDDAFVRVFLPGEFNNWGNNSAGRIAVDDASRMEYDDALAQWTKSVPLQIGSTYQYKIHFHYDESGSDWTWISDPLNPRINPADNNNSVVTITDPMIFEPATERGAGGFIEAVSAGLFGTAGFEDIAFEVNGVTRDGKSFFDPASGIFRYVLDHPVRAGSQFMITATDSAGQEVHLEIGEIQPPITWLTPHFETFVDSVHVRGSITRQDGTIDPTLTGATLIVNGSERVVSVDDGIVRAVTSLQSDSNRLLLRATVDGATFTSDTLVVRRLRHPLSDSTVTAAVTGSGQEFSIRLDVVEPYIPLDIASISWEFDSTASTAGLQGDLIYRLDFMQVEGTSAAAGELYFDVTVTRTDGAQDFLSVAVIVEEDGTVRPMRYAETAGWIDRAVVYEIFPLSFGSTEASGSVSTPGRRFDEITEELDYIARMGFTTLWFMPIFHNQIMDQLSGGYNVVDFYNVDPKLGTNEDFKELVNRAHELGLKVVLDITPSHVSPAHPWVDSVRDLGEDSPFYRYLQTTPSAHDRGLDDRGANLPEIWHTEGGRNLYRKYEGFGDLANLNWDDDDLQARLLHVLAYWVREFDIDGWRFDVYWGPWRRYGPERFGRPIRQVMKRMKPDAWLLGEIAGTGHSTEVYYADDDHGTRVVGGIDAGYDWNFYFNGIRGGYANLEHYDNLAHNNGFWPGPHARYFRFLENHDETRIAKIFSSNPDRILPLTGFLLTTTGIPMIYQGQEVNFGNVSGDERRRPVSWQTERNGEFAPLHQQLIHARTTFPAFWTQDLVTLTTSNGVYGYVRPYRDENAVVLVNFLNLPRTISIDPTAHIDMSTDGPVPYTNIFADTSFADAELDGFTVTLSPYETAVFITRSEVDFTMSELPSLPFGAVYTGADGSHPELPQVTELHPSYPNPFNPSTTITYSLPAAGRTKLDVFDVLGRRVATLVDEVQSAGRHEIEWNAYALPSGTYVVRLENGGGIRTRTLVLVK